MPCATSASLVFLQNPPVHQIGDVPKRRILRALCQFRPFRGGQNSLKPIEQTVDDLALTLIERLARVRFPEARLDEHTFQSSLRSGNSVLQTVQKPLDPPRNVERAFLAKLQQVA